MKGHRESAVEAHESASEEIAARGERIKALGEKTRTNLEAARNVAPKLPPKERAALNDEIDANYDKLRKVLRLGIEILFPVAIALGSVAPGKTAEPEHRAASKTTVAYGEGQTVRLHGSSSPENQNAAVAAVIKKFTKDLQSQEKKIPAPKKEGVHLAQADE